MEHHRDHQSEAEEQHLASDELHPLPAAGTLQLVVADPTADDENTLAIRGFNDEVAKDERVDCVMLPVSDGLTLLRKR